MTCVLPSIMKSYSQSNQKLGWTLLRMIIGTVERNAKMKQGTRLKYLRKHRSMTMKTLGMRMGFDEKASSCRIAQWEQGFRNPSQESIESLAKILNVAPARLAQTPENPVDSLIEYLLWLDEEHSVVFYSEIARLSDFLSQYWSKKSALASGEISVEFFREWKLHWEPQHA